MRFYKREHAFYCGVDLHAKTMHVCLVSAAGEKLVHLNLPTSRDKFLAVVGPYARQDLAVGCECLFSWYWLADLCVQQNITFVLGHALYMTAIHGGKTKNDKVDSEKIAMLLRGGMLPEAYVYPQKMRATRDLLRRRMYLVLALIGRGRPCVLNTTKTLRSLRSRTACDCPARRAPTNWTPHQGMNPTP